MEIEILNPVFNKTLPWWNQRQETIFYPNPIKKYKYYLEGCVFDPNVGRQYLLLLGNEPFDNNCRKCSIDQYNRLKIKVSTRISEFLKTNSIKNVNINLIKLENLDEYDTFIIDKLN